MEPQDPKKDQTYIRLSSSRTPSTEGPSPKPPDIRVLNRHRGSVPATPWHKGKGIPKSNSLPSVSNVSESTDAEDPVCGPTGPPPPPVPNLNTQDLMKLLENASLPKLPNSPPTSREERNLHLFHICLSQPRGRAMPWSSKYNLSPEDSDEDAPSAYINPPLSGFYSDEEKSNEPEPDPEPLIEPPGAPDLEKIILKSNFIEKNTNNDEDCLLLMELGGGGISKNKFLGKSVSEPRLKSRENTPWKSSGARTPTTNSPSKSTNFKISKSRSYVEIKNSLGKGEGVFLFDMLDEIKKENTNSGQTGGTPPLTGDSIPPGNLVPQGNSTTSGSPLSRSSQKVPSSQTLDEIGSMTFEGLLDALTSSHNTHLVQITLLTYRSFCNSSILLTGIINKFMAISDDIQRFRLLNVIQHWVSHHRQDFTKEKDFLMPLLDNFFKILVEQEKFSVFRNFAQILPQKWGEQRNLIHIKKNAGELNCAGTPPPILPSDDIVDIWSVDAEELARQLTLLDEVLFRNIPPWEFLNQSWAKSQTKLEKAPHISKMIQQFNQLSQWVRTEIVTTISQKKRSEILAKFIETAAHLQKLNNFNSLMQILAALNSLPVSD